MFIINIYLRFALIALGLLGGIALSFGLGFWYGFPFILIAIILLVGYILMGTIQSTALLIQEQKVEEAEKRLALTFKPDWLFSANRAYYNMIKGTLASYNKDTTKAGEYFNKAKELGVNSDNEKAMLELQLANIAATKNKWQQAMIHYNKIKGLKVTEPQIKEHIQQFEKAIKQRGLIKAAGQAGINPMNFNPGGKRRRPKMR